MSTWTAMARRASNLTRLSSPNSAYGTPQAASLIHRRGLAGSGDHHGPPKVNFWQDPMHPSRWKEEQYALVSLTGCGLLLYGGYQYLTRDKKEDNNGENVGVGQPPK